MAIKGKRQIQAAIGAESAAARARGAPRHRSCGERWVQLTAGFLVGVFAVIVLVWVTNSLRASDAETRQANDAAQRRPRRHGVPAGGARRVQSGRGRRARASRPRSSPRWTRRSTPAAKGDPPADAEAIFEQAAADAAEARQGARDASTSPPPSRDQGFDAVAVTSFTEFGGDARPGARSATGRRRGWRRRPSAVGGPEARAARRRGGRPARRRAQRADRGVDRVPAGAAGRRRSPEAPDDRRHRARASGRRA